ncbi:SHOCT domain-containing protein [Corynebacterium hylobatis]|nr:SHOCT domain-containing protein [Corynebacterium hylobatis]
MLDERYARGEIDATEYDEKRRRLENRKDKD